MRDVLAEWRPVVDAGIAEVLPRRIDDAYLSDFFGPASYAYDPEALQKALSEPIWDLLDRGGKRWRAIVCLLLLDGFGEDPHEYRSYGIIPEVLHNGTIIVDDVEDGARLRRGEPALHHKYGVDVALNAGNAMYFLPLKVISHNPAGLDPDIRLRIYEMLMYELNRTHLGQGMDIHWHNASGIEVTEEAYLEMCACKTGCLGRIVGRLASIIADKPPAVEESVAKYAETMCIAFQIGDDILDVKNTLDQAGDFGKEFGNDILEGKKTLMVIHAIQNADPNDAERLVSILMASENSDEEILEAIDILQRTESISYARERALEFGEMAREHLRSVDLKPERAEELSAFTRFVIDRET